MRLLASRSTITLSQRHENWTDKSSLAIVAGMTATRSTGLTARGARTRERIIEVTATLVFRQGAAGTSLDEVMAEAAVSKSPSPNTAHLGQIW